MEHSRCEAAATPLSIGHPRSRLAESGNFTIESFEVERELIKCVWVISKFPKISFRNLATFPGGAQAFRMCFFARVESLGGTNEYDAGFELAPDETEV
jgi:hypothetical protein